MERTIPASELAYHERIDPHRRQTWLSQVILGGQDGLVNVLGVILGVAAASGEGRLVIVAGLAAAIAESISMAAVAYTSKRADGDVYESERARERRHIRQAPQLEKEEIRTLYARKGFEGPLLDRIVETITRDEEVWVAVMMEEELRLRPETRRSALSSAAIVGLSAIIGSLIPILPFFIVPVNQGIAWSIGVAALTLFVFGALKGHWTVGRKTKSGLELMLIGVVSALAGYAVGLAFS